MKRMSCMAYFQAVMPGLVPGISIRWAQCLP
jgi:hypothetical protein